MARTGISIARSVRWLGTGQAAQILIQLISLFTLARLLSPTDFGIMALATSITTFMTLFKDMGTGAAIVQRLQLPDSLVDTIFWFNLGLGVLLNVAVIAIAPFAASALGHQSVSAILITLSFAFPIVSASLAHQALLQRQSKFAQLTAINVFSSLVGLGVALLLAYLGAGVYALVGQTLASTSITTILLVLSSGWRVSLRFDLSQLRSIASFSGNLFLFNATNYFHRNSDTLLIGRFLGSVDLGYYNVAYRILLFPLQNLTFVITQAALPAYSRNQQNKALVSRHYLHTIRCIALVTAPLMALLWALREPAIALLLGPQWLQSSAVIAWLAPVGFIQSITSTSGAILTAQGRTDLLRNLAFVGVPFLVSAILLGLPWGIAGVAAAYCIANVIWAFPVMCTVMRILDQSGIRSLHACLAPLLAALLAATLTSFCHTIFAPENPSDIGSAAASLLLGTITYVACTCIFFRDDLESLLAGIRGKF